MLDITPLFDVSKQIADTYRTNLVKDNMRPEGPLANFTWNVEFNGTLFQLTFYLPKEWYFVEHGRRPSSKMPPVNAIEQWIQVRRIVPRAVNGKVPSTKSLAFAIAKKIQREGFYSPNHQGKHTLEKSMEESQQYIIELCNLISNMLNKEITGDLVHVFDGLESFK